MSDNNKVQHDPDVVGVVKNLHPTSLKKKFKNTPTQHRDTDGKFASRGTGGLKSAYAFNWQRALPVIIIVAATGGLLVYRSFAATVYYRSAHVDFPQHSAVTASMQTKYTSSIVSKDGYVCTETNFNTYPNSGMRPSYSWTAQRYQSGRWSHVASSGGMSANGNRDYKCFSGMVKGATYRVVFKRDNTPVYRGFGGTYKVSGYYHN